MLIWADIIKVDNTKIEKALVNWIGLSGTLL